MDRYLIKHADYGYIALDRPSGGYPYDVADPFEAQMWVDEAMLGSIWLCSSTIMKRPEPGSCVA